MSYQKISNRWYLLFKSQIDMFWQPAPKPGLGHYFFLYTWMMISTDG
jgi:hypothetical protein